MPAGFDWNIGPNDRAYVRVQYDHGVQPTFTDPVNSIFNATSDQPEYQGQINWTHTFGATMTNQFLLATTWYSAIFKNTNLDAALAAFPTSLTNGDSSLGGSGSCGVGLACDDFIWPQGRNVTQVQFDDDVSKTIGKPHSEIRRKVAQELRERSRLWLFNIGLEVPFSLQDFANGGDLNGPNAQRERAHSEFSCFAKSADQTL